MCATLRVVSRYHEGNKTVQGHIAADRMPRQLQVQDMLSHLE